MGAPVFFIDNSPSLIRGKKFCRIRLPAGMASAKVRDCGDKIVTALLPSYGEKPDTNYTNCDELLEGRDPLLLATP
jgi:hypothetical protein